MKKRNKILTCLMVFFLLLVYNVLVQAQIKPNILVIVSDDQGFADIRLLGFENNVGQEVYTPNLEMLASTGWIFSNAYTSGNICAPTRAGIMTGNYQHRNGIYNGGSGDLGMPQNIRFIPSYLGKGYNKGAFGKWHAGEVLNKQDPVTKGFDSYLGYFAKGGHDYFKMKDKEYPEPWKYTFAMLNQLKGKNSMPYKIDDIDVDRYKNTSVKEHVYIDTDKTNRSGIYMTELLTYEALNFIKNNVENNKTSQVKKPFFCYLAYTALHSPAQAPKAVEENIRVKAKKNGWNLTDERITYLAMLDILDRGVGEIVNYLKEEKVFDNTLIIYLTDNGGDEGMEADNGLLKDFKQSNYQGGIRTPFIVSWPVKFPATGNIATGNIINTRIMSLDILPTIMHAISKNPSIGLGPKQFDGKSILPLLTNRKPNLPSKHKTMFWSEGAEKFDRYVFGSYKVNESNERILGPNGKFIIEKERPRGGFAIIDGGNKLIADVDKKGNIDFKLFNISINENEKNNLFKNINAPVVYNLLVKYENWLKDMPLPIRSINAKSFYPPILNNQPAVVKTYKDIYYRGVSRNYRFGNTLKENTISINTNSTFKSIVVQRGYIAELYTGTKKAMVVNGEGKPLLIDFDNTQFPPLKISKIVIKKILIPDMAYVAMIKNPDTRIVNNLTDPARLMDYNYDNDLGKFIAMKKGKSGKSKPVFFDFKKQVTLSGIGVNFKVKPENYKQTIRIRYYMGFYDGKHKWSGLVNMRPKDFKGAYKNMGQSPVASESETVFNFENPIQATKVMIQFDASDDHGRTNADILEINFKYNSEEEGYVHFNKSNLKYSSASKLSTKQSLDASNQVSNKLMVWDKHSENFVRIVCETEIESFDLFDLNGNLVMSKTNINTNRTGFDTVEISDGVYFLIVKTSHGEQLKAKKIIIE